VYLWGLQVFGEEPSEFLASTAGLGEDGDREGWLTFLAHAHTLLERYGGDLPFVHWASYERTMLDRYVDRFGDRDGIAARVRHNLLDLLAVTKSALALPLPSYSLKVVERYVGFERTQDEYGGDWAMAEYIRAVETGDEAERRRVMGAILHYNREDLEATWAVLMWLRSKA
jgi:predicted RecB family nuclease